MTRTSDVLVICGWVLEVPAVQAVGPLCEVPGGSFFQVALAGGAKVDVCDPYKHKVEDARRLLIAQRWPA